MTVDAAVLASHLRKVHDRIERAARAAGRDPAEVRLLAVSKRHPAEAIRALYAAGQRDFGENYAQELAGKAEALADLKDLRWHFIGGMQSNKAGLLAQHGCAVHGVASARAGAALARRASELGHVLPVWVQVNVSGETQKAGVAATELPALVAALRSLSGVDFRGLMTVPPAGDLDAARSCYERLAKLASDHGLAELSMGMSGDLEVAVACGATWVRVGTDLFGPRPGPPVSP